MKKNALLYISTILGGVLLMHCSFWIINYYSTANNFSDEISLAYHDFPEELLFFMALFVAPLLETFFFQFLILKVPILWGMKVNNKNLLILFLLSSFLFSCSHIYSLPYALYSFIGVLYMNSVYIYVDYFRTPRVNGFILVIIIHFFINLSFCF